MSFGSNYFGPSAVERETRVSDVDSYLAAIVQYYSSGDRPYVDLGFPDFALGDLRPEQVLQTGARSFLLGPAGCGKTTFLDWTAYHAARARETLPVYVPLRNYTSNLSDLMQVSVNRFSPNADFEKLLSRVSVETRPAFLLDGIDEIAPFHSSQFETEILDLDASWPAASIVVAGRYQPSALMWERWSCHIIPELTDQQISSYLRLIPNADVLEAELFRNPQLKALVRRPLFLHTFRSAWLHGTDLRSYLMRQIPRYTAWRGHTKSGLPSDISPVMLDELLSLVALDLAVRGTHEIGLEKLTELASQIAPKEQLVTPLADALQATDVIRTDESQCSFSHLTMLESYAARALAAKRADPRVLESLLVSVLAGPFATGVVRHFLGVIPDAELMSLLAGLRAETVADLRGRAHDVLADRSVVHSEADSDDPRRIGRIVTEVARFSRRQDDARRDIYVIAVHGFNTRGDWKNRLSLVLSQATDGERFIYCPWDYGAFRLGILNPLARNRQVRKFQSFFNQLAGSSKGMPEIAVVAHSFGTYIVAHALRRFPEISFSRLLLLGSTLPRSFDWSPSLGRCNHVLNVIGGADMALVAARLVPGLGSAGRDGFHTTDPRLIQVRERYSDHSDLFGDVYMRNVWVPFFRDGTVPSTTEP